MEISYAGVSARALADGVSGDHLGWVGDGLPQNGHGQPLGTGCRQPGVGMDADSGAGVDDQDPDGGRVEGGLALTWSPQPRTLQDSGELGLFEQEHWSVDAAIGNDRNCRTVAGHSVLRRAHTYQPFA